MGHLYSGGLRYVLAYVFLIFSCVVFADVETVPAVMGTYKATVTQWQYSNDGQIYPTAEAACSNMPPFTFVRVVPVSLTRVNCVGVYNGVEGVPGTASVFNPTCRAGDSLYSPTLTCSGLVCPDESWSLNGSVCERNSCPVGEELLNGKCVRDCTALQGQALPNENYQTDKNGNGAFNRCRINCKRIYSYGVNMSGVCASGDCGTTSEGIYYNSTQCTYTGASAQEGDFQSDGTGENPKPNDPQRPQDCLNSGQGYVLSSSGKATCVPSSSAPNGQKPGVNQKGGSESGTPGANGKPDPNSPDYKKNDNSTSSDGKGNVTSNNTETIKSKDDGSGGTTCPDGYTKSSDGQFCSKSTSKTQDEATFCEENPNSTICNESESSFGGNCDAGFSCDGDAATCAIAKATWELNCSFKGDSQGLIDEDHPGGTTDQLTAAEKALNKDGESDFDIGKEFLAKKQAWVSFSSGCPVGLQTFTIGRANVVIDASIVCEVGAFVRMLVHIVAYMALARLFATKLV